MKTLTQRLRKNRKGFTLAELLIVVAIIAVLVAIAVPAFSSSLDKAKTAVQDANLRAAKAEATAAYLDGVIDAGSSSAAKTEGDITLKEGGNTVTYHWTYADGDVSVSVKTTDKSE